MAQCPSCNKFSALEMQDAEVNSVDLNDRTVEAEVRIVRNSECCGDEMKEYTFNSEAEIDGDLATKMNAIEEADPEAEFEPIEATCETIEEGGGRYAKSYYGFRLMVAIMHDGKELGQVELTDKVAASYMDELN